MRRRRAPRARRSPARPARRSIDTQGIIAPGLIDTHNHILFDIFDDDDWLPAQVYHEPQPVADRAALRRDARRQAVPRRTTRRASRRGARRRRTAPRRAACAARSTSGASSRGSSPARRASSGCRARPRRASARSRARSTSRRTGSAPTRSRRARCSRRRSPTAVCANFASGKTDAYLDPLRRGHRRQGARASSRRSARSTTPANCLLRAADDDHARHRVHRDRVRDDGARPGMKLTWSPQSNVSLYGADRRHPDRARRRRHHRARARLVDGRQPEPARRAALRRRVGQRALGRSPDAARPRRDGDDARGAGARARRQARHARGRLPRRPRRVRRRSRRSRTTRSSRRAPERRAARDGRRRRCSTATRRSQPPARPQPGCETIDICGTLEVPVRRDDRRRTDKLDQTYAQIQAALDQALTDADAQTPADGWNFAPLTPLVTCK